MPSLSKFNDILQRKGKAIMKYTWKHKRPQISKAIISKKSKAGGITTPFFKLYYRNITIEIPWYWRKNR
jgi:hypothetical protein